MTTEIRHSNYYLNCAPKSQIVSREKGVRELAQDVSRGFATNQESQHRARAKDFQ